MQKGFENFTFQDIDLGIDYEGPVGAALISYNKNESKRQPILYIHGFSDYFYHPHLAEKVSEAGYNFFALELRKYGRSIQKHQHANYCRSLFEYFPEIDFALKKITEVSRQKAVLLGHSNGGLITSLYAIHGKYKDLIQLLILNSPFLELNLNPLVRKIAIPILGLLSKAFPYAKFNNAVNPLYPKSIDKNYYGEWEINHQYKPIEGFPGYFSWLKAVATAQKSVSRNRINFPTLVLLSSDSFIPSIWSERISKSDIILNVNDIQKRALKLGDNITMIEINQAMHDVFLSAKEVREQAFVQMFTWIKEMNYEL